MTRRGAEWEAHLKAKGMLKEEDTRPTRHTTGVYRGVPYELHSLEYRTGDAGMLTLEDGKIRGFGLPSLQAGEERVRRELDALAFTLRDTYPDG